MVFFTRDEPFNRLSGPGRRRLGLWMAAFFLALAVPTAVLVIHAFGQLKWEAFHQHRQVAQALSGRIDAELARLLEAEEARSFADYGFLVVTGDPSASFLQRSPLSAFPPRPSVPGLVGYFQVDAAGRFSTPLLPAGDEAATGYGVDATERARRAQREARIRDILSDNRLVEGRTPRRRAAASPPRPATAGSGIVQRAPQPAAAAPGARMSADSPDERMSGGAGMTLALRPDSDEAVAARPDRVGVEPGPAATALAETTPASKSARSAPAVGAGKAQGTADRPPQVEAQAAFDQLNRKAAVPAERRRKSPGSLGRVEDLELISRYFDRQARVPREAPEAEGAREDVAGPDKRAARKEQSALPEAGSPPGPADRARILTFESELGPFAFSLLDSGHFVLFRTVWRGGQRYIQGLLIEQRPFLEGVVGRAFAASALAATSNLAAAWDGDLLWAGAAAAGPRDAFTSAQALSGELLHRERLSAPFSDLELVFTVGQLPAGPGARVVAWVAAVIAMVLCGGLFLMYRLGVRQLDLARQQQDFVAAVSHELRTPLTSIRMYAEMLKEGWAGEDRRRSYYQYIFDESERLSRLIANVLQLARMTRNEFAVDTRPVAVTTLMDGIAARVASQVERAGFELRLSRDPGVADASVQVDEDAFSQIVINLVDNAIKFTGAGAVKRVEIHCAAGADGGVEFTVRDHGPGVPRDQMKKIFRLFYRSQNELTRETVGTGIGLALVNELARAMGARVDVSNVDPGARFTLWLPRA